jgi:two-component system chemotaxis response regulator CheV
MTGTCVHLGIGEEHYGLGVEHVLEVAELRNLTAVPGAPRSVLGVINRDGQVIPVVDLATVMGTNSAGRPGYVVVVDNGRLRAGLAVDELLDVTPTPELTESAASELLSGTALIGDALIGMLEIGSVLDGAAYGNGDRRGDARDR